MAGDMRGLRWGCMWKGVTVVSESLFLASLVLEPTCVSWQHTLERAVMSDVQAAWGEDHTAGS